MLRQVGSRLRGMWTLVAHPSPDLGTEEGRSRERHRRAALSALASALAKCLSIVATLISVPLTLHYLGLERFGMWMTISSLVAMLSFADLGIGNGLLSAVADASGRNDRAAIRSLISSGFVALGGIAAALLAALALAYPFVPWHGLFNVQTPQAQQEAGPAVAVVMVSLALSIPGSIAQRVQAGLQAAFIASLWQCAASVLAVLCLVAAIRLQAGLPWLALAFVGPPLLVAVTNSVVFFAHTRPDLAPRFRAFSRDAGIRLVKTGAFFMVLQIVAAVTYASDAIIVAQRLGATAVAEYAVPEKMFGLVSAMLAIALAPLWPAYGEAFACGDRAWIRRTFRRSLLLATATAAVAAAGLVALGPWLMARWVSDAVAPSFMLLLGFGVWKTIEAGGNAAAMYLNGAGVIRFQLVIAIVTALTAVVLKVVLVDGIGVSGAVWASSLAYLIFAAIPTFVLLRRGVAA